MLILELFESGVITNNKEDSDQILCNSVEKLCQHIVQIKIGILVLNCTMIIPMKMSKIKIVYEVFYQWSESRGPASSLGLHVFPC